MRAIPLVVNFHNDNAPIYSLHFEVHGKGRLATGGGDNNVRLWRVQSNGEERQITYLSTLSKHTQAVNVVRFCPRGEVLASAGDDGNVLLWVPSDLPNKTPALGDTGLEDKEMWRVKNMCRSFGTEIYDLAWSPDGVFFITGSMDNIARIYNSQTGQTVRQIAEHNHYVQGVAWDPLNEFVATQSSDRSVHIYTLRTKDGQFSLTQHGKMSKMDLPSRKVSSNSPVPPEFGHRSQHLTDLSHPIASPTPSAPGTPISLPLPMNPPVLTPSRRSSFSSTPSLRRSMSPAPSLPLPAVKPMDASPKLRNANMYANETLTSFFRRLTFTPDGSLLFTPAGQYKVSQPSAAEGVRNPDDVINTVYIYARAGFHKPPITHLPGHKKPSIAVRCSPIFYTLRKVSQSTKNITIDTTSSEDSLSALPEPVVPARPASKDLPLTFPEPVTPARPASRHSIKTETSLDSAAQSPVGDVPPQSFAAKPEVDIGLSNSSLTPAFALPYRMVYAVATQDAVLIYDTQQTTPLCVVSNLHFATFTDLTWSMDGLTLAMSSSDGFCSTVAFAPGELGEVFRRQTTSAVATPHLATLPSTSSSRQSTPVPTPTSTQALFIPVPPQNPSGSSFSPPPAPRPASPDCSSSASSLVAPPSFTFGQPIDGPLNRLSSTSGSTHDASSGAGTSGSLPLSTPPQTPMVVAPATMTMTGIANVPRKRDASPPVQTGVGEDGAKEMAKKRRIQPTVVVVEHEGT